MGVDKYELAEAGVDEISFVLVLELVKFVVVALGWGVESVGTMRPTSSASASAR